MKKKMHLLGMAVLAFLMLFSVPVFAFEGSEETDALLGVEAPVGAVAMDSGVMANLEDNDGFEENEDEEIVENGMENVGFIDFYMSLCDSDINAVSYCFDAEYVVRFYASDEYPEWLDSYRFEIQILNDETQEEVLPGSDGKYILEKGSYTVKWTDAEKVQEMLKSWELYNQYTYEFPEEEDRTRRITVDGEKSELSFYMNSGLTVYKDENSGYVFDPTDIYSIHVNGIMSYEDYWLLPDFLVYGSEYTFDVQDYRGNYLSQETLASPMKEGTYFLTWNNMDEIRELIEKSDSEIFEKYKVVFPDEPLTMKFVLSFQDPDNLPNEYLNFYEFYGQMEASALPSVQDLIFFSDIESKEDYPDWLNEVEINYYDENGTQVYPSDYPEGMPAGTYYAEWVNYFDFLEMDRVKGWGVQNSYQLNVSFEAGKNPTCSCEFYPDEEQNGSLEETGSIFSPTNLTWIFGCTTLSCLVVIVILAVKLKKKKA